MPTQVVMPQMGESVAEGTIVRWLKKVGDAVERDEPLFEISTDKVDAEIPSPAAGVLSEIKVKEGETVPVNSVVAVIERSRPAAARRCHDQAAGRPQPARSRASARRGSQPGACRANRPRRRAACSRPLRRATSARRACRTCPPPRRLRTRYARATAHLAHPSAPVAPLAPGKPWSAAEARELRLSPVVRKIARDTSRRRPEYRGQRRRRPRDEGRHPRLHRSRRTRRRTRHRARRCDSASAAGPAQPVAPASSRDGTGSGRRLERVPMTVMRTARSPSTWS